MRAQNAWASQPSSPFMETIWERFHCATFPSLPLHQLSGCQAALNMWGNLHTSLPDPPPPSVLLSLTSEAEEAAQQANAHSVFHQSDCIQRHLKINLPIFTEKG